MSQTLILLNAINKTRAVASHLKIRVNLCPFVVKHLSPQLKIRLRRGDLKLGPDAHQDTKQLLTSSFYLLTNSYSLVKELYIKTCLSSHVVSRFFLILNLNSLAASRFKTRSRCCAKRNPDLSGHIGSSSIITDH